MLGLDVRFDHVTRRMTTMIRFRDLLKLAPGALVVGLFVGCGEEPAPNKEGAVQKVERAGEKAADRAEKAAEKGMDKMEKAGEKAADAVDKAADKAAETVKDAAAATVGEPPK